MGDEEKDDIGWTKPQKSFKLKKFGKPQRNLGQTQSKSILVAPPRISQPVKRRNPFASVSLNSGVLDPSSEDAVDSSDVFGQKEAKRQKLFKRVSSDNTDSQDSGVETSQPGDNFPQLSPARPSPAPGPRLVAAPPLDWSLKTRVRFVSAQPLGWTQHLSTVEEASGVTAGVRCLDLARGDHCLDTSLNAQFHSCCLYWQYPWVPGLTLYPRYTLGTSAHSVLKNSASAPTYPPELLQPLHADWMTSLQSAYQLVKARQSPFFYLLGPHFTVLFRAAGVSGGQEISACITPTTSGFRAALKREEIEFSLPLYTPRQDCPSDPSGVPESDTTTEFLESLGIEADSLPGLSTSSAPKNRLAAGAGSSANIDGRPESAVLVEGVECQSLLMYLLNAKLTVAGQGVAGLPPTIIAPRAFHGASCRSLKVRQAQVGGRGPGALHSVEVSGPILPLTLQRLAGIASRQASVKGLSVTLHPLQETQAFSVVKPTSDSSAPAAFASASLGDCGLSSDLLELFTRREGEGEGEMIRDLHFREGGWAVNAASSSNK